MSGVLTVWEDTAGCAKKYMCDLYKYLMTVLSYSYGNIMYCTINPPVFVNNVVDGLNSTDKHYLKGEMEIIGKLASKNTSNIVMLPSASKYVSSTFSYQCIHIINNK